MIKCNICESKVKLFQFFKHKLVVKKTEGKAINCESIECTAAAHEGQCIK